MKRAMSQKTGIVRLLAATSALLCLTCSSKPTDPPPPNNGPDGYYVYVGEYEKGSGDFRILKIDTDIDSVVDSVALPTGGIELYCSPDGKQLWLADPIANTRILDTETWSTMAEFEGFVMPVFLHDEIVGIGVDTVLFMDEHLSVTGGDSIGMLDAVEIPGTGMVVGIRSQAIVDGSHDYQYYDCVSRTAGSRVRLVDSDGRRASIRAASADGRLFGFSIVDFAATNWVVFDESGELLSESDFYTPGDIVLTASSEAVLTDPGNPRGYPTTGFLYKYETQGYTLTGRLSLAGYRDPGQPPGLNVLTCEYGVFVPGGKVYITCSGDYLPGPVIAVDVASFSVSKVFYPQTENYFALITMGAK